MIATGEIKFAYRYQVRGFIMSLIDIRYIQTHRVEAQKRWYTTHFLGLRIQEKGCCQVPLERGRASNIPLKYFRSGRKSIFQARQEDGPWRIMQLLQFNVKNHLASWFIFRR